MFHFPGHNSQIGVLKVERTRSSGDRLCQALPGFVVTVLSFHLFITIIYYRCCYDYDLFCFDEGSRALIGIVPTLGKRCFALAGRSWAGPCGRQHLDLA